MTFLPQRLLATLVLLVGMAVAVAPGSANAAQSYDNCTGFIDSLPATISTQGVWCLRANLGTAISSGNAITIATNNVTVDCNDFKLGGLAAGDTSVAYGIYAENRQNAAVRHCSVRGFNYGIRLDGGAGHLVEDNRLDNNLHTGIYVTGDNNRVRRNAVYDTGGAYGFIISYGINAEANVVDNTVAGVFASATNASSRGIRVAAAGALVRDNRLSGLQESGTGTSVGISIPATAPGISVTGNQVTTDSAPNGYGIRGAGITRTACGNNFSAGFGTAIDQCKDAGDNVNL